MTSSDQYQFVRELGAGAMGRVSLVRHQVSGQFFALKRMNDHVAASGGARMRQEFRSLAQINHKNVVRVFEFGEENQKPFLVMEYVQGQDMSEWIGTNPDFMTISHVFAAISDGLSAVHAQGLIHRDLKPENIRITTDGQAKIMDFGLVKVLEGSVAITKVGAMVGTALYMSPEQCKGHQLDYRADLYALGVVLYWALTKLHPFRGDSIVEVVLQHVQKMPIPPRTHNPHIPESLEKICLALLAKKPADRPSSAEAVQKLLTRALRTASSQTIETTVQTARADALLIAPLIGRDIELEALLVLLENNSKGLYALTGDVGIGKTRLQGALSERAQSESMRFGIAEAVANDPTPFGLVKRLIENLEKHYQFVFEELSPASRAELSRIAPQFGKPVPTDPSIPIEIARLRLLEAFAEFLQRISSLTIIALENLHWADESTLALLAHALRTVPEARVIITFRLEDLPPGQNLPKGIPKPIKTIHLEPLEPPSMRALLKALLGGEIEAALEEELVRHADGNPWVLEERLKAMLENGAIEHRGDYFQWNKSLPPVPNSLSDLLNHRLEALEANTLEFARAASILGRHYDFEDVRAILEWTDDQALESLEALTRARLVAENAGTHGENFRFTHPMYHELLRQGIIRLKRKRLHAKAALQRTGKAESIELAEHWHGAENYSKALEYAMQAGISAQNAFAYPQAQHAYRLALEATHNLELESSISLEQRQAALKAKHALGEVLSYTGATAEALRLWREVLEEAKRVQNSQEISALAKVDLVRLMRFADDHKNALELIGEPEEAAPLYGLLCVELSNLWRKDDLPKARAYALAAVKNAKLENKRLDLVRAVLSLSTCVKQPERKIALAKIAVRLAEYEQNNHFLSVAWNDLGSALYRQDYREEAFKAWQKATQYAQITGNIRIVVTADINRSLMLTQDSYFSEAKEMLEIARELANQLELQSLENSAISNIALCKYALNHLNAARVDFAQIRNHNLEKQARSWEARITLELGDGFVMQIPEFEEHEFGFGIYQLVKVLQALSFGDYQGVWQNTTEPNHESDWHWALARVHAGWRLGLRDENAINQILEGRAEDPTLSKPLAREFAVFVELVLQSWTPEIREQLVAQAKKYISSPIGLLARDVLLELETH